MINIEQAKLYIQSILPSNIKVEDVNTILDKISVNGKVYGAFSNGVIYLNSNAPAGTEYHEAFHAVYRTMLTDGQINTYLKEASESLYKELKKEGKSINQLLKERRELGLYQNLTNQEAYDRLFEEHMADKFQAWKQKKADSGVFAKLFDAIKRFFNWIMRNRTELDSLFHNIDKGTYRYSNFASNRFTQGTN
jgi:hypothetical protein